MGRAWPAVDVMGVGTDDDAGAEYEAVHAALAGLDLVAVDEAADRWRIFFRTAAERDRAVGALRAALPALTCAPLDVADEDWAARSQADLRAVRVGSLLVAPPWDRPDAPDAQTIVIEPSMGFGTGHHATTRLCLAALQAANLRGQSVIDAGCGSAVLAIAASLLGAAPVAAFDDDPDAVQAARENLTRNPAARVELSVASLGSTAFTPADVVVANLTGGLLVSAARHVTRLVNPGGCLIVSGLLVHEEDEVRSAYHRFEVERRDDEQGWVCLTLRTP